MIVYISGPMTGYENYNRDAFNAAEKHLTSKGFRVINPAALDTHLSEDELATMRHADYMRRDVGFLLEADLIYLLPGWAYSKGATLEKEIADGIGILRLEDPDTELWRTFEGKPVEQTSDDYAGNLLVIPEPENGIDKDTLLDRIATLPEEPEVEVRRCPCLDGGECELDTEEPEQGEGDNPFAGLPFGVEIDNSLPENTIRLDTAPGVAHHFEVQPDGSWVEIGTSRSSDVEIEVDYSGVVLDTASLGDVLGDLIATLRGRGRA